MLDKQLLNKALKMYSGDWITNKLSEQQERALEIYAEVKPCVIYFQKINNWDSLVSTLEPVESVKLLLKYFKFCFNHIYNKDGFVENIVGDELVALWNMDDDTSAIEKACQVAKKCSLEKDRINNEIGDIKIDIVCGIHCGEVVTGNFGSSERLFFRAIGDNVEIARTLMELNREYKTNAILSERIAQEIKAELRELDVVNICGYNNAKIYELIS